MAKAAAVQKVEPAVDHEAIKREVGDNPIILFMDASKLEAYVAALRADVAENPGDVATAKGRDIIKANAAEIGRKKTAIDKERLRKTEEWRRMTATVNAAGKVVKESFQSLQDETRAPLTAWEEREAARQSEAQAIVADMKAATVIQMGDTAEALRERLERIRGRNLSDEMFGPRIEEVTDLRDAAVASLLAAIERLDQEERDRAELARLREERERRDREEAERLAREQAEQQRAEQERAEADAAEQRRQAEAARIEHERQEAAERAEREITEAADRALREAEERAQAERDRIQREHDEVLAAERRRAEEAERAAQVERDRAAREKSEREEAQRRAEQEQARRDADQAHRTHVKSAVKTAIMSCGADEDTARKIVLAILAREIPHVAITF